MNILDHIKNNTLLRKYNPGGVVIDVSKPMMSQEEYVDAERQKVIDAAYQKSLNRTMPKVPLILSQTKDDFEWYKNSQLEHYQNLLNAPRLSDEKRNEYASKINEINSWTYTPTLTPGSSCLYTFTDNYGDQYRQASNAMFRSMPDGERGFTKIDPADIKAGDGVLIWPMSHMMMFDSYDENGEPLFNHSNGGSEQDAIKNHTRFKSGNELTWPTTEVYRFIGTDADNEKWNNDWHGYRKNYNSTLNQYLRNVPIINMPPMKLEQPFKYELK